MQSTFVLAQMKQDGNAELQLTKAQEAVAKAVKLYSPDLMIFPELYMSEYPAGTDRATCLAAAQSLDGARAVAVVTSGAGVVCGQPVKAGDRFVVWGEPEISVQGDAEIVLCK